MEAQKDKQNTRTSQIYYIVVETFMTLVCTTYHCRNEKLHSTHPCTSFSLGYTSICIGTLSDADIIAQLTFSWSQQFLCFNSIIRVRVIASGDEVNQNPSKIKICKICRYTSITKIFSSKP